MKQVILAFLCLLFAAPAFAQAGDPAAFQFAMPGLRAPDNPRVSGFRLSFLQGKNVDMSGLDFGLLSMSETQNRSGLSLIFGVSKTTGRSTHDGEASGLNAAFINRVRTIKSGANLGFINITDGFSSVDISGVGISNRSNVQLGFVNITKTIDSFQFGFLNIAENGFLPVFPIFNFPKN